MITRSRPWRVLALAAVIVLAAGCEGLLGGKPALDGAPGSLDGGGAPDRAVALLEGGPAKTCVPLPAGCLCAQACSAGVCDNTRCPCQAIPGVSYGKVGPVNPYGGDVAAHWDVNLLLRQKQVAAGAAKGLVEIAGPTDNKPPPQLYTLFTDDRVPTFSKVYQVEVYDWGCHCTKGFITSPEVTLAGMAVSPGEVIQAPMSGYDIGGGHTALVLYAAKNTLTLKYTAADDVVIGYTIHLSGICVEPSLQALYDSCNAAGRQELPAVKSRQPIARALGAEIQVSIRDCGSWMDPRCRKDWWQGR